MMHCVTDIPLPDYKDTGSTGIYQLKRLWAKAMAGQEVINQYPEETFLDQALINILGTGLLPTYQYLFEQKPDFESFEQWVMAHSNGHIAAAIIEQCNTLFSRKSIIEKDSLAPVLSEDDLAFWDEKGYVIVQQAVSSEDCAAARNAILEYLEMDEQDEASWYKESKNMQGIMVPLYRNEFIDRNRNASKIKRAFEQIWNRTDLIVTTDKCGFNPPEKPGFSYRGTGLHWDVSLATPIPFGTQGLLYLTDTAANQGALTVVPGFHKTLERWLQELPGNIDPRTADFSEYEPQPIAANAGDFIIWNHQLPHGASPNRAEKPRIVQYINWYAPLDTVQQEWV